jgi:hypothetical protein
VGLAALVGEIACPPCRVGVATSGNTIPSIAAGLPTKTVLLRTGSAERLAGIPFPGARPVPGSRLGGKVAICRAAVQPELARVIEAAGLE